MKVQGKIRGLNLMSLKFLLVNFLETLTTVKREFVEFVCYEMSPDPSESLLEVEEG